MATIKCTCCGESRDAFERAPFPGAIGAQVLAETCRDCWGLWLKQQTMLINHYGLNVMDPQAREFLTRNMRAFLFKAGAADSVDVSRQGTINY